MFKIKKETAVIVFYVLYFVWLFVVTYLTFNIHVLNYFTFFVAAFYIIFLREKGDVWWFIVAGMIPVFISLVQRNGWEITFSTESLQFFPPWLAIAWATTIVALRKLYFVIYK